MALSEIRLASNGTNGPYAIKFALGVIRQSDVTCYVDGEKDATGQQAYRQIEWSTDGLVYVKGDPIPNTTLITFQRTVPLDEMLVNYEDRDIINAQNLNTSQKQLFMLIHQILDGRISVMENFDARLSEEIRARIAGDAILAERITKEINERKIADQAIWVELNKLLPQMSAWLRDAQAAAEDANRYASEMKDLLDQVASGTCGLQGGIAYDFGRTTEDTRFDIDCGNLSLA